MLYVIPLVPVVGLATATCLKYGVTVTTYVQFVSTHAVPVPPFSFAIV